jgi:hypothetical protein
VAKSCSTRTGSSVERIVTALVSRMRRVVDAIAAITTAGDEIGMSSRWCSPTPKTSRPASSASFAAARISEYRRETVGASFVCGSGVMSPKV